MTPHYEIKTPKRQEGLPVCKDAFLDQIASEPMCIAAPKGNA